jgi:LDH2 family malate/lactate/ureidoglycolate dehydrogenase
VSSAVIQRYGFDDLRRVAAALGTAVGLPPVRSLTLAAHLLWFDAAGAPTLGIATLPSWLEEVESRRVNPTAIGRVLTERTAVALFDGENGPTPLVLERAAEVAVQKARESAVGLVRVVGAASIRSAAPVAAGIGIGPMAGWVLGPNRCWSMALPSPGGLPLVVDSGLSAIEAGGDSVPAGTAGRRGSVIPKPAAAGHDGPPPASPLLEGFWLGTEALVPEDGWLVAAVSIPAIESFATFDERLAAVARRMSPAPGRLLPEAWETQRREVRQQGIALEPAAWKSLAHWARRLSVDVPEPLAD